MSNELLQDIRSLLEDYQVSVDSRRSELARVLMSTEEAQNTTRYQDLTELYESLEEILDKLSHEIDEYEL
jgi:uncharacterized protein Yka (UPF0111/DUF47 family)